MQVCLWEQTRLGLDDKMFKGDFQTMKKSILAIACLLLAVLASGCGCSSCSRTTAESTTSSSTDHVVTTTSSTPAPEVQTAAQPYSGSGILVVSDSSFSSNIRESKGVAVVDFDTTWCAGCKRLAPVVDELAREFAGSAIMARLDIDDSPATATAFNIYKIPCLILFKNGKEVDRFEGYHPKEQVKSWMQKHGADPSVAIVVPQ